MIIGECPYEDCAFDLFIPLARNAPLPAIERHECEYCGRIIWTQHSRIDPKSWTDEHFKETHDVDEETKNITPKPQPSKTSTYTAAASASDYYRRRAADKKRIKRRAKRNTLRIIFNTAAVVSITFGVLAIIYGLVKTLETSIALNM